MSALATTQLRAGSSDDKAARDAGYRVEVKQFGLILKDLVKLFNALTVLNAALGQAGKGAYLQFPNDAQPGGYIPFNRKHLRSANAQFARMLVDLKNYLRVSKKKPRERVSPDSFSGPYTPVYAGEALRAFFTAQPGRFGPLHPSQEGGGEALMDNLPLVQQGYLLRNTNTVLFYIYAHANQLQYQDNAQLTRADDVMMQAFGGNIPASFYSYLVPSPGRFTKDGRQISKSVKVPMDVAVAQGLISGAMNTFQVISASYPSFDPNQFKTYYYQNISALNYYSKSALAAAAATDETFNAITLSLQDPNVRANMLAEQEIAKNTGNEWKEILAPVRKAQKDSRKRQQDAMKRAQKARGL